MIYDWPLRTMLSAELTIGVALVRLGRYAIAVYEGQRLAVSKTDTRYVKGKHHAGGTSQRRFQRVRENQIHRLYAEASGVLDAQWRPWMHKLDYVALGGEAATVNGFPQRVPDPVPPVSDNPGAPPGRARAQPRLPGRGWGHAVPVPTVSAELGGVTSDILRWRDNQAHACPVCHREERSDAAISFPQQRSLPHRVCRAARAVSVLGVKVGCQGLLRGWVGNQVAMGCPRRATALSCSSSLRMMATRATFPGLPRSRNRW